MTDKTTDTIDTAMVSMIEVNARSMTRTFLDASWRNAFDMAAETGSATWRAIRDIYGRELDRRDAEGHGFNGGCAWGPCSQCGMLLEAHSADGD